MITKQTIKFSILTVSLLFISCNQKEERNYENIKKIKKNMDLKKVTQIMGEPDFVTDMKSDAVKTRFDSIFIYNYKSPVGFSGDFQVWFHKKDSTVYTTYDGS